MGAMRDGLGSAVVMAVMVGVGVVWSVLGCGGAVFLDETLALSELGDGDIGVVCEADGSGLRVCEGGYQAGFVSGARCEEVLREVRDEGNFFCKQQTVKTLRECLRVEACERSVAEACERLFSCVLRRNAERDGTTLSGYY